MSEFLACFNHGFRQYSKVQLGTVRYGKVQSGTVRYGPAPPEEQVFLLTICLLIQFSCNRMDYAVLYLYYC